MPLSQSIEHHGHVYGGPVTARPEAPRLPEYNPFIPPHSQDPYPFYAALRAHAPVHFSNALGAWVVSRYEDVVTVLRDPARFSSRGALPSMFDNPQAVRAILADCCPEVATISELDPPYHTRMRRLHKAAFSPRRVERLRPEIQRIANQLVDAFIDDGCTDLVAAYAEPMAKSVVCSFLGIPVEDRPQVDAWVESWMLLWTPGVPLERKIEAAHTMPLYERYIAELAEARRREPQDDALSDMVHACLDDFAPLSTAEIIYMMRGLRLAGHMTTRDWISGCLHMAMRRPDLADRMRVDPSQLLPFMEETMRFDSPHKGLMRTTTEDVVLGGVHLPAGARLQLLFDSANRDESVFPSPDELILGRPNIRSNVGFGKGVHACQGALVATVETEISLQTVLTRIPSLRLDTRMPLVYLPSHIFRSLTALHAIWDRA